MATPPARWKWSPTPPCGSIANKPPMRFPWVFMRDPNKYFEPQAMLSTDLDHTPEQSLPWFIRR